MLRDALACSGVGGNSGASFLPLPNPKPGEPTHIIADGANAVLQVRHPSWTADTLCRLLARFFLAFFSAALSLGRIQDGENAKEMAAKTGREWAKGFRANAVLQVGRYDNSTEKLTLEPALFPIDHGTFAWQGEPRLSSLGCISRFHT